MLYLVVGLKHLNHSINVIKMENDLILRSLVLCSTVTATDKYPIGFKQCYSPNIEEILDESFIGVVNCDAIPPKTLHVPVLADSKDGTLLFHLNPISGTW